MGFSPTPPAPVADLASVVALLVYAVPIYLKDPSQRGSQADITQVDCKIRELNQLYLGAGGCTGTQLSVIWHDCMPQPQTWT